MPARSWWYWLRPLILLVVGLLVIVGGYRVFVWFQPKPTIDASLERKIKQGMTAEEVERTVGVPPGNYYYPNFPWQSRAGYFSSPGRVPGAVDVKHWQGDDGTIAVYFDAQGKALWAEWDLRLKFSSIW
jgi:hypothetical protein